MGEEQLWTALAQVSATLAGFTLASFGIYIARSETIGTDDILHRYSFQEFTSLHSWNFIFLDLLTFMMPTLLSLLILVRPDYVILPWAVFPIRVIATLVAFLSISIAATLIVRQGRYIRHVIQYHGNEMRMLDGESQTPAFFISLGAITELNAERLPSALREELTKSEKANVTGVHVKAIKPDQEWRIVDDNRTWAIRNECDTLNVYCSRIQDLTESANRNRRKFVLILILYVLAVAIALSSICGTIVHVLIQIGRLDNWFLFLAPIGEYIPAEWPSVGCLVIGTILIYFHFYIFQPSRLLFTVDDATEAALKRTKQDIEKKCSSLGSMQKRILSLLYEPDSRWIERIMVERRLSYKGAMDELKHIARELEGRFSDPFSDREEFLLNRTDYHVEKIDFLIGQQHITYDGIIRTITGIELFLDGLNSFELQLNEKQDEIQEMIRYVDMQDRRQMAGNTDPRSPCAIFRKLWLG